MADGRLLTGDMDRLVTGFAYDSRQVQPGQCFVALRGEHADGHDYVAAATSAGAVAALVARPVAVPGAAGILVRDPLLALGQVAALHRAHFAGPVVAITGSVGKTTTKEMTAAVLAQRFRTVKSEGNLNSEVGLPIALLNTVGPDTQVTVMEMGMRGRGEIAYLASIARPQIAVVTNVGTTHLELLGSVENIARAKAELVQSLDAAGTAVLNADDPPVAAMARTAPGAVMAYGLDHARAMQLSTAGWVGLREPRFAGDAGQEFVLETPRGDVPVHLPVPGRHMAQAALAAAAVGITLGLSLAEIANGLANYVPAGRRMRICTVAGVRLVDDSYNAAPASMKAALESARQLAGTGRLWAVLGDMFELGRETVAGHAEVGQAAAATADRLLAVGEAAVQMVAAAQGAGLGDRAQHFGSKEELGQHLLAQVAAGDTVLVKGSRGMHMEEIVSLLENHLSRFDAEGVGGQ